MVNPLRIITFFLDLPSRLTGYLILAGVVTALVLGAYLWVRHNAQRDLLNRIDEVHQEAADAADSAADAVDVCIDLGGVPDPYRPSVCRR